MQQIATRLADIKTLISGDATIAGRNEPVHMSISSRASALYSSVAFSQSAVGGNYRASYRVAADEFTAALRSLRLLEADLGALETSLDVKGAPWTPGRVPDWTAK